MPILTVLAKVFIRVLLGGAVSVVAVVIAFIGGALGSGGGTGITVATVVGLFCIAWSVLPAVRQSRTLATLCALLWVYLGYRFWQFGAAGVRGWIVGPWVAATIGALVLLIRTPPVYAPAVGDLWPSEVEPK
jgi:hypothetical protein